VFCAGAYRTWPGYLHQRAGAAHAQDADCQWSRLCEDGGTRKRRGARAGRRRTVESTVCRRWVFKVTEPSSIPYRTHSGVTGPLPSLGDNQFHHSFVFHIFLVICFDIYFLSKMCNFRRARGAAHAQDADDQWSRQREDGGERKRCEDGGACTRCEDGGARQWRRNEQSDWAFLLRRLGARAGRRRPVESTV
jgi:hypothetical protein